MLRCSIKKEVRMFMTVIAIAFLGTVVVGLLAQLDR